MDTRLFLISHAATAAQRAGRFPPKPGDVEPLDARALLDVQAAHTRLALPEGASVVASPSTCARATAEALGLTATPDDSLADLDYGDWHGERVADLATRSPQELAAWMRDPDAAPPGGESFTQLVKRIGGWMDTLTPEARASANPVNNTRNAPSAAATRASRIVAITHTAPIRAAIVHTLRASPAVFARIEIAPLSVVELRRSSRGWTWWPGSL